MGWRESLIIVKPETFIGWHCKGFRLFWTKLSRRKTGGRPSIDRGAKALIMPMAQANPMWGAPRIHGEHLSEMISIDFLWDDRDRRRMAHQQRSKGIRLLLREPQLPRGLPKNRAALRVLQG
jgi:hypothetical protein